MNELSCVTLRDTPLFDLQDVPLDGFLGGHTLRNSAHSMTAGTNDKTSAKTHASNMHLSAFQAFYLSHVLAWLWKTCVSSTSVQIRLSSFHFPSHVGAVRRFNAATAFARAFVPSVLSAASRTAN